MKGTLYLLAMLIVLAACGSDEARRGETPRPLRELFPPNAQAQPEDAQSASAQRNAVVPPAAQPLPSPPVPEITHWPLSLTADGSEFRVYEPIIDFWRNDQLEMHALVLANTKGDKRPRAGTLALRAITQVDRAAGTVSMRPLQLVDAAFASGPDTKTWGDTLAKMLPSRVEALSLPRVEAALPRVEARARSAATVAPPVPRIIVSQRPAVLVYIDGEPRYAKIRDSDLLGVVNTRALLLKSPHGVHFLHVYDGWVSAPTLDGPWTIASAPSAAAKLERTARSHPRANLLAGTPDAKGRPAHLTKDNVPQIIVSETPSALIVVDGAPTFTSFSATKLQYASNTSAHLFRDLDTRQFYARVNGRWFRATATAGPWEYVRAADLPAGFAAIPEDSNKHNVRSRIAAALQSEAGAAPGLPKVAAVATKPQPLPIAVDGDPMMQSIPGTRLRFVANASVPLIAADRNGWYAVQNGAWFHASQATGPWTAATSIPPDIDAISPSDPMFAAIQSHVMAVEGELVYYGCYPDPFDIEDQGSDYQYTPPSSLYWGWLY